VRSKRERAVLTALALLLTAVLAARLYTRGGPYFARPETIVDHVGPHKHEARDVLVLLPKVRPLLPRGARVTCFRPIRGEAPEEDTFNFFAAVGQLPHQKVDPPFIAMPDVPRKNLIEWVIAVYRPFTHPAYRAVAAFPEGRLYRLQR
jgi:hypothetical protein